MQAPRDSHQSSRIFGLDALRAAAILLVLASHTWPTATLSNWAHPAGVLGVELFFALSGFLIGGILLRMADTGRLHTWGHLVGFWRRRWYRTLPDYYLFLALHMAWRSWVLGYPGVFETFKEYFFFLQNFLHPPGGLFRESWSLTVEEWFYLLFAFFLWAGLRLARKPAKAWLAVIGCFLIIPWVLKLVLAFYITATHPDMSVGFGREVWEYNFHNIALLRLDALMYGVAGAYLAARRPGLWQRLGRFWWCGAILAGIAFCSLALGWPLESGRLFQGLLLSPCMSIGFFLIVCRCSFITDWRGWWADAVRFTATISYALYLCHSLITQVLRQFLGPRSFWYLPRQTWTWSLIIWVLSFLVAWVVCRWYEKPMMDLRDHRKPLFKGKPVAP